MKTIDLDAWEKEAVRQDPSEDYCDLNLKWRDRILALIDLVKKKDEILKRLVDISKGREAPILIEKAYVEVEQALALTEQLGEKK